MSKYSLVDKIGQSPPLQFPGYVDDSWVKHKTIIITGGASGFGAGFVRRWAAAGATVVFGDIKVSQGTHFASTVMKETGNPDVHFVQCDVTNWPSQVNLFREAVKFSHHGGIDAVVANAGIAAKGYGIEKPCDIDAENPPPPDLAVLNVNLTGVVYTAHLALSFMPKNPGSKPADPKCDPAQIHRDRHLLLVGSVASFAPIPGQALYGASKHAVLGLYRSLRSSSFVHGVRINLICPYFINTPLLGYGAKVILAGGTIGDCEDVVEAGTRFAADPSIVGRAVFVGPKLSVQDDGNGVFGLTEKGSGEERTIWEIYANDFADTDLFCQRMIGLLNRAVEVRGIFGWASDMMEALTYAATGWWRT